MSIKPKLITVTGNQSNILPHQLSHYSGMVSDAFVIVYENSESDKRVQSEIERTCSHFGIKVHKVVTNRPFDWEMVTKLYNDTKALYPDDWWIVADDDEFQIYSKSVSDIIEECDENGYTFVTGGFIDRIGEGGELSELLEIASIWKQFPMAGFFRYPISNACPNKVTLCKGSVELCNGQHYAIVNGQSSWRWQGWNHPQRYPIGKNFTQVHHFKWDSTVRRRLKAVADVRQEYAYSDEYRMMYNHLKSNGFIIDVTNPNYMFENLPCKPDYDYYTKWKQLTKQIIAI